MLCDWVMEYRRHLGLGAYEGNLELEYDTLVQSLFRSIEEAYEKIRCKAPTQILFINRRGWEKYFLKTRGSLGYMLNISQDMLLLLTALSLKRKENL